MVRLWKWRSTSQDWSKWYRIGTLSWRDMLDTIRYLVEEIVGVGVVMRRENKILWNIWI